MAQNSLIEWTDATWNPLRGCSMATGSETGGCLNCYAARIAARGLPELKAPDGSNYARMMDSGPRWTGRVDLVESALELPLHWRKPRQIFVNSMSDLFHEALPVKHRRKVFQVMREASWHTYQILTKRAEIMRDFCTWWVMQHADQMPSNWWFGVSCENQPTADARIADLLETPAAVRFLSLEPLLGPINIRHYLGTGLLHWVIVGGESGPGARPMHPDWVRSIREKCVSADVPFFFKQWGEWSPVGRFQAVRSGDEWLKGEAPVCNVMGDIRGHEALIDERTWLMERVGKKAAGRLLDGREWNEFPC